MLPSSESPTFVNVFFHVFFAARVNLNGFAAGVNLNASLPAAAGGAGGNARSH
jgi:hypothetical protein